MPFHHLYNLIKRSQIKIKAVGTPCRNLLQMLALSDEKLAEAFAAYKEGLKKKIVKANEELKEVKFEYKTN